MQRLLVAASVIGAVWICFNVRIEGRTPYGHFRAVGGENAVIEGWDWVSGHVSDAASAGWAWTTASAAEGWDAVIAWWSSSSDDAPSPSARTASVPAPARSSAPPAQRAPAPEPTTEGARALARALPAPEASPADKHHTRVDRRILPEEKQALEAKLAVRRSR